MTDCLSDNLGFLSPGMGGVLGTMLLTDMNRGSPNSIIVETFPGPLAIFPLRLLNSNEERMGLEKGH